MNDGYEQEIDLKDLLFFVLSKWRLVIGVTVIFAVLLGGYKYFKSSTGAENKEYVAELEEQYQEDIDTYEKTKSGLELTIKSLTSNIEHEVKYEEDSLLFQTDPNNKLTASADVFVTMDTLLQESNVAVLGTDPADPVVKAYASVVTSGNFLVPFSEEENIDMSYLKELVQTDTDYEGNMFTITVTYKDEDTAGKILEMALESLKSAENDIKGQLGGHSTVVMNQSISNVVDPELLVFQNGRRESLLLMRQRLTEAKKSLADIKKPAEPNSISSSGILKSGIKYGVLGGVLGAFVSVFLICVMFLMSSKLYSSEELKKRFGLKIFGVFSTYRGEKKSSLVDSWLARLEGKEYIPDDEVRNRIAANIRNFAKKDSKILLTGTVPDRILQELQSDLQAKLVDINFSVGYDLNKDTLTLEMLPEHDGIILVEVRGGSKYGQIEKEIEIIQEVKKPILGCIVF